MGFFSAKCKGCGAEICEPEVALKITIGEYDGYGRVGCEDDFDEAIMWHKQCFLNASPEDQTNLTPSDYAPNQGCGPAQEQFLRKN